MYMWARCIICQLIQGSDQIFLKCPLSVFAASLHMCGSYPTLLGALNGIVGHSLSILCNVTPEGKKYEKWCKDSSWVQIQQTVHMNTITYFLLTMHSNYPLYAFILNFSVTPLELIFPFNYLITISVCTYHIPVQVSLRHPHPLHPNLQCGLVSTQFTF